MRNSDLKAMAAFEGRKRYNTGLPCKRGHMSDRQTSNGACIQCVRPKITPLPSIVQQAVRFASFMPIETTTAEMDALHVYLTECVVNYCSAIGRPHALNEMELHTMRETRRPYGEKS